MHQREHVLRDSAHAASDEMPGGLSRRGLEPSAHPSNLVDSVDRPRIEMVAAGLSDEMRIDVERRGNTDGRRIERGVLDAPCEYVVSGHAIARRIEELGVKVERNAEWGLHHHAPEALVRGSLVPGSLEHVNRALQVIGG